jgi:hypothetical protein
MPPLKALGYGLLALVLGAVTMLATLHAVGWTLTALPRVDSTTGMGAAARRVDPGFYTVHPGAYDGQFYWGIALDPLGTGDVHQSFDNAAYRYGHPLYGWLGWLFSAGQARAAPAALAAVGLASLFAAGVLAAWLGLRRGRSGWEALFVALNPGLLFAVVDDLAEPLAAALLLGSLAAYLGGRRWVTLACLALLPLAKEPLILVAAALVAWELWQRRPRSAAIFAAAVVPAAAWWIYAREHFGAWFTSGSGALGAPFAGWRRAVLDSAVYGANSRLAQGGAIVLMILVALLALLALAAVRACFGFGPVELAYIALAAVVACLATNATLVLSDALRNTAVLLVLVPFVLAGTTLQLTRDGSAAASG